MRRHPMPRLMEGGVNVTPLIDIVMCMIIFFMLVAKIGVDTGADRTIEVPVSFLGTDLRDMGNTLVLNVVNGPSGVADAQPIVTALGRNGQLEELKIQKNEGEKTETPLLDTLKYFQGGDAARGVAPNPDFKVIIRGDKSLTYQFLAPVLIQCNLAHVKSFAFNTKKP